jgi:hypothetical protein
MYHKNNFFVIASNRQERNNLALIIQDRIVASRIAMMIFFNLVSLDSLIELWTPLLAA